MSADDTFPHDDAPEGESPGKAAERAAMFKELVTAIHLSTLEQLPDLVSEHAARVRLSDVEIYLADLQQEVLTPLAAGPLRAADSGSREGEINMDGTVAGRAYQHGQVLPASPSRDADWWVPLLDGTDRLGVLHVAAPDASADTVSDMQALAGLIALMVVSKRGLSDSYDRLVRRRRMDVAAEMEWRLMPPRTFATDKVVISAIMEPAYEISGDAYDYAFDGRTAQLAVFDAMGHDTAAGLTANLALTTARNTRRHGAGLTETADAVEHVLLEQFGHQRFTTGILAALDVDTGTLEWLNRGHHPPVIIRGRTTVSLACPPAPPMGTGLNRSDIVCRDQLEPGDRLLLYTDGITEARSARGQEFGLDRFTDFLIRHEADELPVPETLRRLIRHHLDYHHGELDDDATVLLLEWHGPAAYAPGQAEDLVGLPQPGGGARTRPW